MAKMRPVAAGSCDSLRMPKRTALGEATPALRCARACPRGPCPGGRSGTARRRAARAWPSRSTKAIIEARPSSRRPGLTSRAKRVSTGSTTQPVMPLEHHRCERRGRLAVVLGQARHPQGIAADGARQHVAHELAGEVQRQQAVERRVQAEGARAPRSSGRRTAPRRANVRTSAPKSQAKVAAVGSGAACSQLSPILTTRTHSSSGADAPGGRS